MTVAFYPVTYIRT